MDEWVFNRLFHHLLMKFVMIWMAAVSVLVNGLSLSKLKMAIRWIK